jgi:2',3'-cyclic-nucleotide 2'-phosphodiesterase (5'-nucleotidase family)
VEREGERPAFLGPSQRRVSGGQVTKGSHMIEVLNLMGVHCSVVGNHDLDFGVQNLCDRIAESHFP